MPRLTLDDELEPARRRDRRHDREGLAGAVERLTTDRAFAAELGRNGRTRAAELSWANTATEIRAGLARVLEG